MAAEFPLVYVEVSDPSILTIRDQKVMLDNDLASLFGVETGVLNRACARNADRFPTDFRFQLNEWEFEFLRFQIGISRPGHGGRRYRPYAFTEHGVVMAASVLNTPRAVEASVFVVRAFVRLRHLAA